MIEVEPGTVLMFSDISCPWARLAVHRFHAARAAQGLQDVLHLEHHWFPLELVNKRATPRPVLDAEIPVAGGLEPALGWTTWPGAGHDYPVTMFLPTEAVRAADRQGPSASEELDLALRDAFLALGRNISLLTEVLDIATGCSHVDETRLAEDLWTGEARASLRSDVETAQGQEVRGSPHLFLSDGSSFHNPGIKLRWEGRPVGGFPRVEADDPSVYEKLVLRAAEAAG